MQEEMWSTQHVQTWVGCPQWEEQTSGLGIKEGGTGKGAR